MGLDFIFVMHLIRRKGERRVKRSRKGRKEERERRKEEMNDFLHADTMKTGRKVG